MHSRSMIETDRLPSRSEHALALLTFAGLSKQFKKEMPSVFFVIDLLCALSLCNFLKLQTCKPYGCGKGTRIAAIKNSFA